MGKPRGQRNAAREKYWPGANAGQLRTLKRDIERFSVEGRIDWELVQKEADREYLRGMPAIDREGIDFIDNHIAVNVGGVGVPHGTTKTLSKSANVYQFPKKVVAGHNCQRCGRPKSIYSYGPHCRTCYRDNAKEKRAEWMEGYNFWAEKFSECATRKYKTGAIHSLIPSTPDFVPELIERISASEDAADTPVGLWRYIDVAPGRRALSYSNDSFDRMVSGTAKPTVRYRRPKWKTLRGQWA